jgi:hypothetical protein
MLPLFALLAVQAAQPKPLPPAATPEMADARCLATFSYLIAREPAEKDKAQLGLIYFAGKLKGRNPGLNFTAILHAAGLQIAASPVGDLKRCAADLATTGNAMVAAGNTLAHGG